VIRLYQRVTGKTVATPELPRRPIWIAAAACSAAWVLYGISFCVFARGVAPVATGEVASYVAAFTASYILGYVMLFAPGGLGVRDVTIAAFLEQLHLTTGGAGVLVAFASRLWLTVLEVLPGLVYLVAGARRGATATQVTPH
jgi:hypothetical protein